MAGCYSGEIKHVHVSRRQYLKNMYCILCWMNIRRLKKRDKFVISPTKMAADHCARGHDRSPASGLNTKTQLSRLNAFSM